MDVLLLGAAAVVLIAITLWIIWQPSPVADGPQVAAMPPQGNDFEDQYTSATADLSAAGVALSTASPFEAEPPTIAEPVDRPEAVSVQEPAPIQPAITSEVALPRSAAPPNGAPPRLVGIGAAALLTLGGAVVGAWLYSRWTRERSKPINQLRRRFR